MLKYSELRKISEILDENPDAKYTLADKLWNYLQDYVVKHKAKGKGFGLGVTTRVGLSVIALILQHKGCGVPVASFGRLLTSHIPNVAKQRLPLQSLTQLAA